jgi:hypothetical protein
MQVENPMVRPYREESTHWGVDACGLEKSQNEKRLTWRSETFQEGDSF